MDTKEFIERSINRKLTESERQLLDLVARLDVSGERLSLDVTPWRRGWWPPIGGQDPKPNAIPLPIRKPTITEWENAALRTMTRRKLTRVRKRWNAERRKRQRDGTAWMARWDELTDRDIWHADELAMLE